MTRGLRVETARDDGFAVLRLSGEADLAGRPALHDALQSGLELGDGRLVVDLTDLAFVDSTAIAAFLRAHRAALARDGRLVLAAPGRTVSRVLSMTQTHRVVPVVPDVETARAEMRAGTGTEQPPQPPSAS